MGFYCTATGAALDLVIERGGRKIGTDIKFSSASEPARGFWQAVGDLGITQDSLVALAVRRYQLAPRLELLPIWRIADAVGELA